MKRYYKSLLNSFLLAATIIVMASCSRQQGSVSINSEKLRKSSLEIENSNHSDNVVASTEENAVQVAADQANTNSPNFSNVDNQVANNKVEVKNEKAKKVSPLKTMIAKKVAKKAGINKTTGLDKNLKLAIIFAAIAIILSLFWGPVIGLLATIAWIVAIVFLVLWILEQ